jgi:hypothetical protein
MKQDVAWQLAEKEWLKLFNTQPDLYQADEVPAEISNIITVVIIYKIYQMTTAWLHEVADKQLYLIKLSLKHWILKFASIINSNHTDSDLKVFAFFYKLF